MRGIFGITGCVEHQKFIADTLKRFNIKLAVETGTLHGWTAAFLSDYVEHVYTIEIRDDPLEKAKRLLADRTNINIYYGNSVDILEQILPTFPKNEKVFFYLDAHWLEYWPLFDELKTIGKFIGNQAVIIIDDFKVPEKLYAYDSYNGISNDMNTIEPYLKDIYGERYEYEYTGGEKTYQLILDEQALDEIEKKIYTDWFKGKVRQTTGKILLYGTEQMGH